MVRLLALAFRLLVLSMLMGAPAFAQAPADSVKPATAEIEGLVRTLEDEGARKQLVEQLKALLALQRQAEADGPADLLSAWGGKIADAAVRAWGADWLGTEFGRRMLGSTLTIGVILLGAYLLWKVASAAIARYLERMDAVDARQARASGRARTLLPLARNALQVVLLVMVVLTVLAEFGVNIAPLLAGAGVVGIAIGFGAQKLVQDVITGAFILFEDTICVGDVVRVDGHAGMVEFISIRVIRLRDLNGNVHTIPFSSVGTIINMTKEFSYSVLDVGVAYREDTDHVTGVLVSLGEELRADAKFGPLILEPMEVMGVDRFDASAVVIRVRFKTLPLERWNVMREFNRRMKRRFDELGIEIPYPHTTIYFGEDRQGAAPPARIRIEDGEAPTSSPRPPSRSRSRTRETASTPPSD